MNKKSRDGKGKVAVVVLNYKGITNTKSAIASLAKQTYRDFTIVSVENGSGDNSTTEFKRLEKKYGDKLHTIYNDRNLGFAGGVNSGIYWSLREGYDYIALFNNDAVADKEWLASLVSTIKQHDGYGIVTGLLLLQDGETIDSTGEQYSKWGLPFPRNRKNSTSIAPTEGEVFGATGGASLYHAAMLRDIGLFDEAFFAYYEDVDISFRAQLAGWKVFYTPKAIAYHKQGATSKRMPGGFTVYQTFKNLPVLFVKNVPTDLLLSIGFRFYFAYILMFANAIKNGNGIAALKGLVKSLALAPHAFTARFAIQKAKKVPTTYIKHLLWPDLPPDQTGIRKLRRFFTGRP